MLQLLKLYCYIDIIYTGHVNAGSVKIIKQIFETKCTITSTGDEFQTFISHDSLIFGYILREESRVELAKENLESIMMTCNL